MGVDGGHGVDQGAGAAGVDDPDDGHDYQGGQHHQTLDEVGVGHGQESADEGVDPSYFNKYVYGL